MKRKDAVFDHPTFKPATYSFNLYDFFKLLSFIHHVSVKGPAKPASITFHSLHYIKVF